ncbi:MAG TPA: asparagine synthase-related protein [Woeseiaceae bacterium]|nr:asparagine synthase-related protein [Woeseiaceae bacterium]
MPGISGFISREPIAEPEKLAAVYDRVHALDNATYVKTCLTDRHAVIHLLRTGLLDEDSRTQQTAIGNGCHLFLEGEVFDFGVGNDIRLSTRETVAKLGAMFLASGGRLADNLNGEYNIVVYDSNAQSLLLFADHLSTQPMYYKQDARGLHFGSEKKSLLAAATGSVDLDPVGLLQIFHHRHYVGDRTFIKDIKRLPPGGILEYRNGKLQIRRSVTVEFGEPFGSKSPRMLLEEWADLLQTATTKRLGDNRKVAISLSAGLDSRTIALSIDKQKRPLWARTRGVEGSDELVLGRRIATQLGFEHMTEDPVICNPSKALDAIAWRTEGEATIFNGPTLLNHEAIKSHGDFLAGGYLGDVCSGSHIDPRMLVPMSLDAFAQRVYNWYVTSNAQRLRAVFTQDFLETYLPSVRSEFIDSYTPLRQERNVDTHQLWDLNHRQTRMTMAAAPADSHILQRVSPFYDRNIIQFVTRIPLRFRIGQVLYKSLIYQMGPEIRDVPNSNTLHLLKPGVGANRIDYLANLGQRLWSKAGFPQILGAHRVPYLRSSETKSDMLLLNPAFRTRLQNFIDSEFCDPAVFDKVALRALLQEHYTLQRDNGGLLGLVGTFAAALPMFVYSKTLACPENAQPGYTAQRVLRDRS